MAFTDTRPRVVQSADTPINIVLAGTVYAGDPVGFNGTGWVEAIGSATAPIAAQLFALEDGVTEGTIAAARRIVIVEGLAGATLGDMLFLSATAGKFVIAAASARQALGYMVSATLGFAEINGERGALAVSRDTADVRPFYSRLYGGYAGCNGEALRGYTTVLAAIAAATMHGIHGAISFNAGASVAGLAAGIRATLDFAANTASPTGTYCALQVDSNIGAGITVTAAQMSFIRAVDNGAVLIPNFLSLPAAASGNCVVDTASTTHNHCIKVLIGGALHYIPVSDAAS
jgi:hypothetical protein